MASGYFANTPQSKRQAQQALNKILHDLPFEVFKAQIDSSNVPKALQLEQVFVMEWSDVEEDFKSGRCVVHLSFHI